jgi:hypothetical protein
MGLPTAWRLARQHGGDVRFDGNPHGPTRFVLALPAVRVAAGTNGNGHGHPVEQNGRNGAHAVDVHA